MVGSKKKMVGSKKKGFVSGIIVGMLVFSTLMVAYTTIVSGASPSVVYASPDNTDTFVDVWRGKGVNVTVNVSDGDGDLNQVVLKWNNSGSWDTFYDSGALGGVSYHNHTQHGQIRHTRLQQNMYGGIYTQLHLMMIKL